MMPLIKKYSPKTSKEIIGQEEPVKQLKSFILDYKKQKKRALLLFGPTGTGKTSSIYAITNELDLEIFELNASDFRNQEQIREKLGASLKQQSLFSKGKVLLVDEIDGLSGTQDRGGIPEILRLIEDSKYPVILTIANPYDNKFSSLRSKCFMVEFHSLTMKDTLLGLKRIVEKEKIQISEDILKVIARNSSGDYRASIIDLEVVSSLKEITHHDLEEIGVRERGDTIINALLKIFKTTDPKIAIKAFENVKEDIDEQILWIDENIPYEYENPADLALAYDKLSKADIFSRRIKRWQYWRFLVYINALITAGIAVSKDKKYDKFVQYKPTGRLLKIWWANQRNMKKKAIARKIAINTHTSTRQAVKLIPYFQIIFKKNRDLTQKMSEELKLDEEEVEWLVK
jgi:replication factor C large subunit